MMDTFQIELLVKTAKAPTEVSGCYGMLWQLYADSFAHAGMQDVTFDLNKTFYGSKLNGRATKDGYLLQPKGRILVRTGLSIDPPIKYYAQVVPIYDPTKWGTTATELHKKGLLIERKIIMDGEIDFVAVNLGHKPIELHKGEAIAQFMMKPVYNLEIEVIR
jgi:dUTPase